MVLLRDISELRRRDRLLLSKDATIREIHHRVKNNLQTISSLLRLQGRRLSSPEAKAAIEESVRRIRSIALVHEILSHEAGDDVPFVEIVRPLVRMVEEGLLSPDHPIEFKVTGDAGKLPATVATPLAVVLTELLQNVVDHAYPAADDGGHDGEPGQVLLELDNDGARAAGAGDRRRRRACPRASRSTPSTGLGLSIVRTLVTTELAGTHRLRARPGRRRRPGHHGRPAGAVGARVRDPRAVTASLIGRDAHRPPGAGGRSGRVARRSGGGAAAWRPPTGGAACGAPPRRCRPRRRSPGWWSGRTRGTAPWPRTASQTALAASIWSMAGPVVPTGKNRSGSVSRQAATSRHWSGSIEIESAIGRGEGHSASTSRAPRRARTTTVREANHMPPRWKTGACGWDVENLTGQARRFQGAVGGFLL